MKFSVKNAHGDEISGNVEVNDDRIRKADGDFANLVGSSSSSLFKLLKVWTNFDAHTPSNALSSATASDVSSCGRRGRATYLDMTTSRESGSFDVDP